MACDFFVLLCDLVLLLVTWDVDELRALAPLSAALPVFVVALDLPEDVPALLPLVGLVLPSWPEPVPPCAIPVPVPAAPVPPLPEDPPAPPAPPEPPAPPPCACAMPIAPSTATVAASILIP